MSQFQKCKFSHLNLFSCISELHYLLTCSLRQYLFTHVYSLPYEQHTRNVTAIKNIINQIHPFQHLYENGFVHKLVPVKQLLKHQVSDVSIFLP
jgi:hypothetical protein